ncbi:MAG: EAL domain-containing protein [gamma proteobacterium endosymbiont of Lamellibrachia anaximandri]|nr:EAL domain-containing protein [gamma proteobacterium endosymbiont of Lamellibrachia anaximandri]
MKTGHTDNKPTPVTAADFQRLNVERLKLLYSMGHVALLANQATALVAVAIFWRPIEHSLLLFWFFALGIVNFAREFLLRSFHKHNGRPLPGISWQTAYMAGAILSGILWGLFALFLDFGWPLPYQVAMFLLLTGLTAGAIPSNAVVFPVYLGFSAPVITPLLILLLTRGDITNQAMAGMVIIYLILVIVTGRNYARSISRSLALRMENRELLRSITSANDELSFQASHDPLTGLNNRREFEHRLEQALDNAQREHRQHVCIYMDLDQFKIVNDTCGHAAGDELLRELAVILEPKLRSSDILARLGGDEFGILLDGCSLNKGMEIAHTFQQTVEGFQFFWEGKRFQVNASIGVVCIDQESAGADTILSDADMACYAAKDLGRGRVHLYEKSDKELAQRRIEYHWVSQLRGALDEDRFLIYKQDIVPFNTSTKEKCRAEILLRLQGERGEIILPGQFLPAAERYGLMMTIDRWVIERSLRWLIESRETGLLLNVNLSGVSLGEETTLTAIRRMFVDYPVDPGIICFEVTETAAIANMSTASRFIEEMRGIGCSFALDDFGSGLSSFAYLKHLPVDFLKIDGDFVKDVLDDPVDRAVVEAVITLSRSLGISTIAEHVESAAIKEEMIKLGVDYGQGFALARPVPLD